MFLKAFIALIIASGIVGGLATNSALKSTPTQQDVMGIQVQNTPVPTSVPTDTPQPTAILEPTQQPTSTPTLAPTKAVQPTKVIQPTKAPQPTKQSVQPTAIPLKANTNTGGEFTCNCSKTCPNMSCSEAQYQLKVCGCSARDADDDGVACDSQCQ